jgi:hypothetical protein
VSEGKDKTIKKKKKKKTQPKRKGRRGTIIALKNQY